MSLICPYCNTEITEEPVICPNCHNSIIIEKKNYFFRYCIIAELVVALVVLSVFDVIKYAFNNTEKITAVTSSTTITTTTQESKNKGNYSGVGEPTTMGNVTTASLVDEENTTLVDVLVTRYLSEEEINTILSTNNQTLNDGFKFVGIEYNVTFNDLTYLNGNTISPILNVQILEGELFNRFFLIDGVYYRIEPISYYNGTNITNGENATIDLVFQVPIGYSYYVCFGATNNGLGCYKNI